METSKTENIERKVRKQQLQQKTSEPNIQRRTIDPGNSENSKEDKC